jgi:hypothetical protein
VQLDAAFFFHLINKVMFPIKRESVTGRTKAAENIDQRFQAGRQYPGEQIGKDYNQVRAAYSTGRKLYSQRVNLNAGSNPAIDINLPKDGRILLGISLYYPYANTGDQPQLTLNINNTIIQQGAAFRQLDTTGLQSNVYYPIDVPLSGNDRITLDVIGVTAGGQAAMFNFHYC